MDGACLSFVQQADSTNWERRTKNFVKAGRERATRNLQAESRSSTPCSVLRNKQ